ncbi:MAG TPA: Gfo/Idh/MocA family oxidoreductase [Anaeromyxobacter sp.]|nr:Gfo/Idh/MocA family oxidoreductase [Anaeromyxobacter sp.]
MTEIGVGLVGTGFMGDCHAQALAAVGGLFEPALRPRLELVADVTAERAGRAARKFGFRRATTDWRALVNDPAVGLVSITSPNALHKEMALAAVAAGKHVWCEKPLALDGADAAELARAAAARGVVTLVGYNYLRSPAIQHARRLIERGELGEPTYFRACFDEDYLASPDKPFSWRCERAAAGTGTLGDMGSHALCLGRFLLGEVAEVCADMATTVARRPLPGGGERAVENEDIAHALLRFQRGVIGTVGTSRVAWGRKNGFDFEVHGTGGTLRFTQERFNELQLFLPGEPDDRNGFRTILTGPAHPPYGRFNPATGHGLGFNELKVAEAAELLAAIAGQGKAYPDFGEAAAIEAVMDAMVESTAQRRWVAVKRVP